MLSFLTMHDNDGIKEIAQRELAKLDAIMGSSVNKAFDLAVVEGATVAGETNTKNKFANVDALPKTQFLNKTQKVKKEEGYKQFRKKPLIINARRLTKEETVETLEGTMTGRVGDWKIIGIKGELYFCKPDIFEQTYETVE